MTREKAIEHLENIIIFSFQQGYTDDAREALEMAIEALKAEPCEDAISRERAIKQCGFGMTSLLVADCLRRLPPVTPKQRTGKWIREFNDIEGEVRFTCSSCGEFQLFETDFCPNCGAKMEGESE